MNMAAANALISNNEAELPLLRSSADPSGILSSKVIARCVAIFLFEVLLLTGFLILENPPKRQVNDAGDSNGALASTTWRIQLLYRTQWSPAYLDFDNGSGWTNPPGKKMAASQLPDYVSTDWQFYELHAASLQFVPNDGHGDWDHAPGGGNYMISKPGRYTLQNGVVTFIKSLPSAVAIMGVVTNPSKSANVMLVTTVLIAQANVRV